MDLFFFSADRAVSPARRVASLVLCGALIFSVSCMTSAQAGPLAGIDAPGWPTGTFQRQTSETATRETATGETATAETAVATLISTGDTILEKTPDAGRAYVNETLFIGDSNTVRYMMYADEDGTPFTSLLNDIGVVSMGADSIVSLKCEQFKGYSSLFTIPDSVAMLKPQRIVICFGTNNLSGSSTDATKFIASYRKGLKAITDAWPYADIIVSAIPPLDKQRENTRLTMIQVNAYNQAIVEMCEADGYHYLNSNETLADASSGWAKKDYTLSDGVHLSKTAVTAYFDYFRTHAYLGEDRRPTPLGKIPTPDGSPVGLISSDPIAVRGAKVPVEFVASEGGKVTGSTSQMVAKGGTCSAVTAVPNSGWKFAGWTASYGSVGSSSTVSFTVPSSADAGGVVLTAHFEADAHEHDYIEVEGTRKEPTCEYPGSAKYECSICGATTTKEIAALGHKWGEGVITTQPSSTSTGTKTYTCSRCGKTKTETLPKLAATVPPTAVATIAPVATPAPVITEVPATEAPVVTEAPAPEVTETPATEAPVITEAPAPVVTEAPVPESQEIPAEVPAAP